mmetsp:Transcript_28998/g.94496  ORF Transcript_28998/g.94496 Transcript_28998/m.94496 type:complete len:284 (+) Transcript_28998:1104-1955(+)
MDRHIRFGIVAILPHGVPRCPLHSHGEQLVACCPVVHWQTRGFLVHTEPDLGSARVEAEPFKHNKVRPRLQRQVCDAGRQTPVWAAGVIVRRDLNGGSRVWARAEHAEVRVVRRPWRARRHRQRRSLNQHEREHLVRARVPNNADPASRGHNHRLARTRVHHDWRNWRIRTQLGRIIATSATSSISTTSAAATAGTAAVVVNNVQRQRGTGHNIHCGRAERSSVQRPKHINVCSRITRHLEPLRRLRQRIIQDKQGCRACRRNGSTGLCNERVHTTQRNEVHA